MKMDSLLIVEDDGVIAAHLLLTLERLGFTVAGVASSGEEALKLAAAVEPTLAVMDIGLAGVLDGIETAALLRSRFDIPVVYLSAHIDNATLMRAKATEPVGYLAKPFQQGSLRTTLEMGLHAATVRRQLRESEASRQVLERQVQAAQKAESLSVMAGGIAHLFNNLLQVVTANLAEVREHGLVSDVVDDVLKDAIEAARRAADVSKLLRTYLGQSTSAHEARGLAELCRGSLPALRATLPLGVSLEATLPAAGPMVQTSASEVRHLLESLVANAKEALGQAGGSIRLSVTTLAPETIPETNRFPTDWKPLASEYARIVVTDQGCGIPAAELEKIFDPFFTTKFVGRGLGLPSVLGVVRAHGGAITVQSAPGMGSRFELYLPIVAL